MPVSKHALDISRDVSGLNEGGRRGAEPVVDGVLGIEEEDVLDREDVSEEEYGLYRFARRRCCRVLGLFKLAFLAGTVVFFLTGRCLVGFGSSCFFGVATSVFFFPMSMTPPKHSTSTQSISCAW